MRRRKTKIKFKKMTLAGFVLMIFLVLYIPSFFIWFFGNNIITEMVTMDSIEDSINTTGYIIRDEEVLKSPFKGKYISDVNEGEKVQANSRVATVLKDSSEDLLKQLRDVDLNIIQVLKNNNENQSIFSGDVMKIENDIADKVKLLITESNSNSLVKTKKIKNDIDLLVRKKSSIIGGAGTQNAYVSNLKAQKALLQEKIRQVTREITSGSSGIITYSIDGYESSLNPASIKDLTPEKLGTVKARMVVNDSMDMYVDSEKPFAKLIKNVDNYMVVCLEPKEAGTLSVDDLIKLRISDIDRTVDGVVNYKSNELAGKYIIAVKFDKCIPDLAPLRVVNVDLIKKSYKGLKVPLKSLIISEQDPGKGRIFLSFGARIIPCDVKIIGKNEESAIIDNEKMLFQGGVSLYDTIITNPKQIPKGQIN